MSDSPVVGSTSDHLSKLVQRAFDGKVGGRHADRLRRTALLYTSAAAAFTLGKQLRDKTRDRLEYLITVEDIDEVYFELHQWLFKNIDHGKLRTLNAFSVSVRGTEDEDAATVKALADRSDDWAVPDSPSGTHPSTKRVLKLRYTDTRKLRVPIGGHKVEVKVVKNDQKKEGAGASYRVSEYVEFKCSTKAARDAVVDFLAEMTNKVTTRPPKLIVAGNYGWEHSELPPRRMETVIFPEDGRETIVADLNQFLCDEQIYVDSGMPWHRGYLLYGPPGTGKTSFARALATHFGLDVYYIPLSSLKSDTDLNSLVRGVGVRSILLLEDIDVVHGARERDDKSGGITLSSLLNALDGVITPHGLITVMTTNDITVLDKALLREGRADVKVKVDYLDQEQFGRVVALLGPDLIGNLPPIGDKQITAAAVLEALKSTLHEESATRMAALDEVVCSA